MKLGVSLLFGPSYWVVWRVWVKCRCVFVTLAFAALYNSCTVLGTMVRRGYTAETDTMLTQQIFSLIQSF